MKKIIDRQNVKKTPDKTNETAHLIDHIAMIIAKDYVRLMKEASKIFKK